MDFLYMKKRSVELWRIEYQKHQNMHSLYLKQSVEENKNTISAISHEDYRF